VRWWGAGIGNRGVWCDGDKAVMSFFRVQLLTRELDRLTHETNTLMIVVRSLPQPIPPGLVALLTSKTAELRSTREQLIQLMAPPAPQGQCVVSRRPWWMAACPGCCMVDE
jgi:hypothetical protein